MMSMIMPPDYQAGPPAFPSAWLWADNSTTTPKMKSAPPSEVEIPQSGAWTCGRLWKL